MQLWWLLPIIAAIVFLKSPTGKGIIGEGLLNFVINLALNKKKYQLLKNITLRADDGTTQIDHIIVSHYGVFAIETKNYKGWIFGNEHSKTWTQSIYGKKNTFQNPLHQNYKHLKTLQKLLSLKEDKIFSVIVFVGEATFKTDMPKNVVYPLGLLKFIKSHHTVLFTPREMWRMVEAIEDAQLAKGFKTHQKHVKNLKSKKDASSSKVKNERFKAIDNLICPRCGNDLIMRTAKRGQNIGNKFYGCKSYPRCRYTRNIEG
ncbi:NERD domain-containing protein [Sulfurimonas sp. NW7]|uniref:NERD domain-containing protein n=1 Tax=Sulfurimonas sp. NW7 TaxID=2922727 RepID=UPI003DA81C91